MMKWLCAGWIMGMGIVTAAPVRSGHATVDWLAESSALRAGGELRTALKITIDANWHTYWTNPGEAGMPTSVEWKLPDGWQLVEFSHPAPARFLTGDLTGYGHQGTAWFPARFKAPEGFTGAVQIKAVVSWLSCNQDACVSGEAEITLRVEAGEPSPGRHAGDIARAFDAMPVRAPLSAIFTVEESGKQLVLRITGEMAVDPAAATTFAQTPEIIDPAAIITFRKSAGAWEARVAKSPYARGAVAGLELLLVPPSPGRPVIIGQAKNASS